MALESVSCTSTLLAQTCDFRKIQRPILVLILSLQGLLEKQKNNLCLLGEFSTRTPSACRQCDSDLSNDYSPNTIKFCSSERRSVHLSCFPNRAPSRRRRKSWHSWSRELCHTISLSISMCALCNWSRLHHWLLSDYWSFFQFMWRTVSQTSRDDSWQIVNSPHSLFRDELLLEEWYPESSPKSPRSRPNCPWDRLIIFHISSWPWRSRLQNSPMCPAICGDCAPMSLPYYFDFPGQLKNWLRVQRSSPKLYCVWATSSSL